MNSISGIPRPLKISLHKRTKLEQNASRYVWAKAGQHPEIAGIGIQNFVQAALAKRYEVFVGFANRG